MQVLSPRDRQTLRSILTDISVAMLESYAEAITNILDQVMPQSYRFEVDDVDYVVEGAEAHLEAAVSEMLARIIDID